MKKEKDIVETVELVAPVAPPEPTDAELIARRNAALAEYGIVDQRAIPDASVPDASVPDSNE